MGWTGQYGITRKQLIEQLTKPWSNTAEDGTVATSTCIAHCFRGIIAGTLWMVRETVHTKDGVEIKRERWIGCSLLRCYKVKGGGVEWLNKDMDESMFPFFYSCPMKYLEMVPTVACVQWRDEVRLWHSKHKRVKKAA